MDIGYYMMLDIISLYLTVRHSIDTQYKKRVHIMPKLWLPVETDCCDNCPLMRYDEYYDRFTDSGFDCIPMGRRIVNEGERNAILRQIKEYEDSQNTLFPKREIPPVDPLKEFPDWCPLMNLGDE